MWWTPRLSDRLRNWSGRRLIWPIAAILTLGGVGRAQQPEAVYTLRAYANVVQVPVLVLDPWLEPMAERVDLNGFRVSLDSGKKFPPRRVRVEGEDPIGLAIVLDMSGYQKELIQRLPAIAAEFAAQSLHPQDRVSIYALSCNLLSSANQMPPDPKAISLALDSAIHSPNLGKNADGTSCGRKVPLWNAMAAVTRELDKFAGRRVMLIVSDGDDDGSTLKLSDVHEVAVDHGVALFGLNDGATTFARHMLGRSDRLASLCESTGGIVLHPSSKHTLENTLDQWITLVRGRYIVEFPAPRRIGAGAHRIDVSIAGKSSAFVTLSGVSVALPDPQVMADPNTVHSDAGDDIPVGNRRPLPVGHH